MPQTIEAEADLVTWLRRTFPLFTNNDVAKVLQYYPSSNASVDPELPLFATNGNSGPTALNQSTVGTGQQQRANNIYAEATLVCPSYWIAEAYSNNIAGGQAYKYQFSVPPALHAYDVAVYFSEPGTMIYSVDIATAFQKIIGNFVVESNPSITSQIANGVTTGNMSNSTSPVSSWPPFTVYQPMQVDLNTTCQYSAIASKPLDGFGLGFFLDHKFCGSAGDRNSFRLVNAYEWEGGRGMRCDFWRAMGELVPE